MLNVITIHMRELRVIFFVLELVSIRIKIILFIGNPSK